MSLLKRMILVVLARGVGVFIVAGEGKEKHSTVFFLGIVYPGRNELNLHLLGVLVLADDAATKEIDRLQTALVAIVDIDNVAPPFNYLLTADRPDNEVCVAVGGIEKLVDLTASVVLTVCGGEVVYENLNTQEEQA